MKKGVMAKQVLLETKCCIHNCQKSARFAVPVADNEYWFYCEKHGKIYKYLRGTHDLQISKTVV